MSEHTFELTKGVTVSYWGDNIKFALTSENVRDLADEHDVFGFLVQPEETKALIEFLAEWAAE